MSEFQFQCSCGDRGPFRSDEMKANSDATAHDLRKHGVGYRQGLVFEKQASAGSPKDGA